MGGQLLSLAAPSRKPVSFGCRIMRQQANTRVQTPVPQFPSCKMGLVMLQWSGEPGPEKGDCGPSWGHLNVPRTVFLGVRGFLDGCRQGVLAMGFKATRKGIRKVIPARGGVLPAGKKQLDKGARDTKMSIPSQSPGSALSQQKG